MNERAPNKSIHYVVRGKDPAGDAVYAVPNDDNGYEPLDAGEAPHRCPSLDVATFAKLELEGYGCEDVRIFAVQPDGSEVPVPSYENAVLAHDVLKKLVIAWHENGELPPLGVVGERAWLRSPVESLVYNARVLLALHGRHVGPGLTPMEEFTAREPKNRLRKAGVELRKDGTPAKNPQRMGPILLEVREQLLGKVLALQAEVNAEADRLGRPRIDILNAEEEARIRELIALKTWPEKWDGDEPHGDEMIDLVFPDGTGQPLLPMFGR